jgi:4'-phosphopantetheinyl transferase
MKPDHLQRGEVVIVRASLIQPRPVLETLAATLTEAERERAAQFVFDRDREASLASRGILRHLLSRFTGVGPESIRISLGAHGKPEIESGASRATLRFNVAHADGLALIALARDNELGIDVERIAPERIDAPLVARALTAAERALWEATRESERPALFFEVWTAKESVMKACGLGLALDPLSLEVLGPHGVPTSCPAEGTTWALSTLRAGEGWRATLASSSRPGRIVHERWDAR